MGFKFKPTVRKDREATKEEIDCIKETEEMLAMEKKLPLIGICRGMQLINEFFNGKNVKSDNLNHVGKYHNVKVKNLNFKDILGEELKVNSFQKAI